MQATRHSWGKRGAQQLLRQCTLQELRHRELAAGGGGCERECGRAAGAAACHARAQGAGSAAAGEHISNSLAACRIEGAVSGCLLLCMLLRWRM
jgi:hypothetical protein